MESFDRRSDEKEMFISMLDKVTSEYKFASVKSCLAIGPGDGFREIGFIEKCTANVTKFIAIEHDHEQTEIVKAHLRKRLPDVEGLVIKGDFHSWNGPSEPVDLIEVFHVLYNDYFKDDDERRSLLRKVHDSWLKAGGYLAVLIEGHWSSNSLGKAAEIYERLGRPVTRKDIEALILEAGFIKKDAYEFQYMRDFSNPDEALLRLYQMHANYPVTLDDVRSIMKELFPNGKTCGFSTLALYQKAL